MDCLLFSGYLVIFERLIKQQEEWHLFISVIRYGRMCDAFTRYLKKFSSMLQGMENEFPERVTAVLIFDYFIKTVIFIH